MKKVIEIQKQSKKAQKKYHASKRGSWYGLNPITRVIPDKRKYNRKTAKASFRRSSDLFGAVLIRFGISA